MMIYFDNAATTKPCAECIAAIGTALTEQYGNPSSLHSFGYAAQKCVDEARANIAKALSCEPDCITFTSGATESNHLAVRGIAGTYGNRRRRIVTSTVEHASVRAACDMMEEQGFEVIRVAPDENGQITPEAVLAAVNDQTCLVTMMRVNNETGAILPISEIFAAVKAQYPDVITHCDAVQGFMKLPLSVRTLHADLLTVSGHKVHAAKGIGALYHKKGIRLKPVITGGEQEAGLRTGTESVPLIMGFGAAVAALSGNIEERFAAVSKLRETAEAMLSEIEGVTVQSKAPCSPYVLSISVKGLRSETMLHFLADKGIYVSSGSACSKGKQSGVLQQFGIRQGAADSTLRLSFCAENTAEELSAFCDALKEAQSRLVHKRR